MPRPAPWRRWTALAALVVISIVVTRVCRFYAVPPPGSLFFIMAAAIGAYSPVQGRDGLLQRIACVLTALTFVIGAVVGLVGGACLHSERFRSVVWPGLRKVMPEGVR